MKSGLRLEIQVCNVYDDVKSGLGQVCNKIGPKITNNVSGDLKLGLRPQIHVCNKIGPTITNIGL